MAPRFSYRACGNISAGALEFGMRIMLGILFLMTISTSTATEDVLLDHDLRRLASDEVVNLSDAYAGKVLLIVNTASKCGNTPQYEGLEKLYQQYGDDGLVVLGFPSNDFLGQEPGTEQQIQEFCRLTYKVAFPMFEKVTVKKGTWNFHKYLIGRDGRLISEFSPRTKPYDKDLVTAIEAALET
jgi:glutathione peroxidase